MARFTGLAPTLALCLTAVASGFARPDSTGAPTTFRAESSTSGTAAFASALSSKPERQSPVEFRGVRSARFRELLEMLSVAGHEEGMRKLVAAGLPNWARPETDSMGNLAVLTGSGRPRVLIAAPLDADGYIVSGITAKGYLRLHQMAQTSHALFDQYAYGSRSWW